MAGGTPSKPRAGTLAAAVTLTAALCTTHAQAIPGTHPEAVSTFDTRSSSVVLAYRHGIFDGTSRQLSYYANFTATTGNFSAQFGAHYLQLRPEPDVSLLHGAAASGTALWSLPLSDRYPNAVPKTAIAFYVGAVPTAAVNGEAQNFLAVPMTLGIGFPLSPSDAFTITPWLEGAPTFLLASQISETDLNQSLESRVPPPSSTDPNVEFALTQDDVRGILSDSVELEPSMRFSTRAGLQAILRLDEHWDFNFYGNIASHGSLFRGTLVGHAGGGLVLHWDRVVSALRPPPAPDSQACQDIAERYRACSAVPQSAPPPRAVPPRPPAQRQPSPQIPPPPPFPPPAGPPPPPPFPPVTPAPPPPATAPPPPTAPPPAAAPPPPPAAPAPAAAPPPASTSAPRPPPIPDAKVLERRPL